MLAISSNSMATSIHEELSPLSTEQATSKNLLKQTTEFKEWVSIVEKDNPELFEELEGKIKTAIKEEQ